MQGSSSNGVGQELPTFLMWVRSPLSSTRLADALTSVYAGNKTVLWKTPRWLNRLKRRKLFPFLRKTALTCFCGVGSLTSPRLLIRLNFCFMTLRKWFERTRANVRSSAELFVLYLIEEISAAQWLVFSTSQKSESLN